MISRLGLAAGCLLVLIPAMAIGLAIFGDVVTPDGVATSELEDEQVSTWAFALRWGLILRHISIFPYVFGAGMLWLLNWHNGYGVWPVWLCVVLGGISMCLLGPLSLIAGLSGIIAANTSPYLAFWK